MTAGWRHPSFLVGFSGQCCLDFAYKVGVSSYEPLHSYAVYVLGRM